MSPSPDVYRALRSTMRARRRGLDPSVRADADRAAQAHLVGSTAFERCRRVALYRAFDGEVATDAIAAAARETGRDVVYARVVRRNSPLAFVRVERWQVGRAGLPEPEGPDVALAPSDLLVVPGLAFDGHGHRVGFGGGYYDRTLATVPAVPVGLAYDLQRVPTLPARTWDRPVRWLATESGLHAFDSEEPRS